MTNTKESWETARENEQRIENRRTRARWIVGPFLQAKARAYNALNSSNTTFIYVGQVLEDGKKEEEVIGYVRNIPHSHCHGAFCFDIDFLPEKYDLTMQIDSGICCLGGDTSKTKLFPYVGDISGVERKTEIIALPSLRQRIQEIIDSREGLDSRLGGKLK